LKIIESLNVSFGIHFVGKGGIAHNVHALAMAGHSMNFQPEQKYRKRTNSWDYDW